jgi:uncharacterized membrane protein YbaN (DUF454 family)
MKVSKEGGTVKPGLLQKVGGGILVGAGVVGLALPILPGWLLIFAGLALMGEYRLYRWVKERYQKRANRPAAPKENE